MLGDRFLSLVLVPIPADPLTAFPLSRCTWEGVSWKNPGLLLKGHLFQSLSHNPPPPTPHNTHKKDSMFIESFLFGAHVGGSEKSCRKELPVIAAAAKSLQSCPTLCDPIDGSPPGAPVPRILQARTLEWVAISFSSA